MRRTILLILLSIVFLNTSYSQKVKKIKKVDSKAKTFESYEVLRDDQNIKNGNYLFRFKGQVQVQGQYSNNLKTGEWIYMPGDNLKIVGSYTEDQKTGEWKYYRNENLISILNYEKGERIGKSLAYHENGILACEFEHIDGEISGKRKAYYDNGQLKSVINYNNGEFDGDYEMYSKIGELQYTINYKDGVPFNLDIKTKDEDSILVGGNLKNGNGQYIVYYKRDKKRYLSQVRTYKDSKLNGKFEKYNYNAELTYRGQYMKGFMVGMWNYNLDNPAKRNDIAYNFSDSIIIDSTKQYYNQANSVFDYSDIMPKFDESSPDQFRYFISSVLHYPIKAQEMAISGKVYIQFKLSNLGLVYDIRLVDKVDPLLDAEALRVLQSSPFWVPGFKDQIPVDVIFHFPIVFQLR